MKKRLAITAAILALASGLGSLALQSGHDQFQKALAKERSEGNLEEAIALYQKAIEETKDESPAAQAQLRIGICYEKLGPEKANLAQEAFQRVVDRYPGQTDSVGDGQGKIGPSPTRTSGPGKRSFPDKPASRLGGTRCRAHGGGLARRPLHLLYRLGHGRPGHL
ncbi:MAG: tetratricopeptide repeat protein [Marinilabiliales bacterium]|nr:tetratricopeptide repeat protein [Marinilabiliales bacterium]